MATNDWGDWAKDKFGEEELKIAVKILEVGAEVGGQEAVDEMIDGLKMARENFNYNADHILPALEKMKENFMEPQAENSREMTEEEQVKAFRVQADALMAESKRLAARFGSSRAYSLMFTHAELSKMYGGKRLEEMGTEYPAHLADKSESNGEGK